MRSQKPDETQQYLNECLSYDAESGLLYWKNRPSSHFSDPAQYKRFLNLYAGKEAGCTDDHNKSQARRKIRFGTGKWMPSARVIWIMHNGPVDKGLIVDHINGNSLDDRIQNFRIVTMQQNVTNKSMVKRGTKSGYKGVCKTASGIYMTSIMKDGISTRSYHKTAFGAALEYDRLAVEHHGEFARLNFPEKHSLTWQEK